MLPFHLLFASADSERLGTPDEVVARIAAAVPEIAWSSGPSSFDEIKSLAGLDLPWSEEQRTVFSLPKRTGTYQHDKLTLRISGFESCPLTAVHVSIEGDANPLPFLVSLCDNLGWKLLGSTGRDEIPILGQGDDDWRQFRERVHAAQHLVFGPPDRIRIPLDEHRFDCVGRLRDGRQFMAFGTGCFPAGFVGKSGDDEWRQVKRWISVLHLFDSDGNHLKAESCLAARDSDGKAIAFNRLDNQLLDLDRMLAHEGAQFCDILVKPFSMTTDGVTHGLLYTHHVDQEEDYETEWVMLEPRDIMFHPPWDSGEYST